jgi:putative ABC transport system permease protein
MPRTTLAGLRAHKLRRVATALAIVLGVGFVSGTLIFGDTAKATLFDEFARSMKNVDVVVDPPDGAASVPITTPDTARGVSGVATADGRMVGDLPLLDKRGGLVTNGGTPGIALSAGSVPQLRGYGVSAGRAPVGPGEAALDADTAKSARYTLGDTITVLDRGRARRTLTLVGVVDLGAAAVPSPSRPITQGAAQIGHLLVNWDDLAALHQAKDDSMVLVRTADGIPAHRSRDKLDAALADYR